MARLDRFSVYCLVAGWFFFRKQMAENELAEREEDARKNAPLSPRARGFAGRKGMTVMAMETGMGRLSPAGFGGSLRGPTKKFF